MWFTLAPVDLAYVSTAPRHVCRDIVLDVSAPGAFEVLTGDRWLEWFPELRAIQWNPPRAVGGTRYVRLGRSEAHETFRAWEPAKRFAFSVDRSTLPVMKALLVDFQLTAVGDGRRTRLEYCWHYEIRGLFKILGPSVRKELERIVSGALAALKTFVER
jgi:hypothetical protein